MSGDLPSPEFSRVVSIARLGDHEAAYPITANEAERAALARRFGLVALDRFAADVRIARNAGGGIRLKAAIEAEVVQECVATLEPFASRIADDFTLVYQRRLAPPSELLDVEAEEFELLAGDEIDIGEAVAQQLSLALDPFPRAPDVGFPEALQAEPVAEARSNPFAELAKLAKK
jgi:uncharacterized metal-binding protein YceD (DUF177 family)